MTRKSIWPLAAGVLFVGVITTLVDVVLHLTRVFPPLDQPIDDMQALLATSYRIVIGVGGAWLTAKTAPSKPMKHVMWLGAIGTLVAVLAVVGSWNLGLGPRWYPVAIAVLAI